MLRIDLKIIILKIDPISSPFLIESFFMNANIFDMFLFIFQHRLFLFHMILIGILNTLGQIFIYRMVNDFKQHFVPFVLTSRKIFTVLLSIVFYQHQTNIWQMLGVFIVFVVVTYQFITQLKEEKQIEGQLPTLNEKQTQNEVQPQTMEYINKFNPQEDQDKTAEQQQNAHQFQSSSIPTQIELRQ